MQTGLSTVTLNDMTGIAEIFVGLLLTVAVLAMLARKLHIPYLLLRVGNETYMSPPGARLGDFPHHSSGQCPISAAFKC